MLFMASIVLGIAAVVAIESFSKNLTQNISLQSKSLMGADFIIDTDQPPTENLTKLIDSLGGARARETSFSSMAAFEKGTRLVQVRGIEPAFPIYGTIETIPESASKEFHDKQGALVDATVMAQYDLEIGDQVKIGKLSLPISGALKAVPGSSSLFSSVAPPVLIPYNLIGQTGLIQTGSRIDYSFYFSARPGTDMEALEESLEPDLEALEADLDTHVSTSRRLGRRYENFGRFLNLVAFIALLLGCVGISSAVHIYIKEKLRAVAVLKCLGATRRQTFLIYLLQIAAIGLLGGLIGTGTGLLLQELFPLFLGDLLPVEMELQIFPQIMAMGLALGLIMSLLFALYPLSGTLQVSPLQALRVQEGIRKRARIVVALILSLIFLFIFLFAFWLLEDAEKSLVFMAGLVVVFSLLALVAQLFLKGIRKYFPSSWSFPARQSLLNLSRPNNQTLILILAIGVGSFLISTLYFTRNVLMTQAKIESGQSSPNMILLDVQTQQTNGVRSLIKGKGLPVIDDIPIVTMRVAAIGNRNASQIRKDTASGVNDWVLRHEFRVTYRDSMISSEKLQEGDWIGHSDGSSPVPISVSADFAQDALVGVGDSLRFNVQGVMEDVVVSSIRTVDWARLHPNFSIVFPKGVLEEAPQFRILTTRVPGAAVSANLQQELVRHFPNITILDLRQILATLDNILDKISWLINFMAFFSIITGIIVLIGAVRTSKYQRIRESTLLRTIGATNRQVLQISAMEYLYLGLIGSLSGILLSLVGSLALAWLLFDTAFVPSAVPFLILLPGIILLVLLIGLLNSRSVIMSPPLEVLRQSGRT